MSQSEVQKEVCFGIPKVCLETNLRSGNVLFESEDWWVKTFNVRLILQDSKVWLSIDSSGGWCMRESWLEVWIMDPGSWILSQKVWILSVFTNQSVMLRKTGLLRLKTHSWCLLSPPLVCVTSPIDCQTDLLLGFLMHWSRILAPTFMHQPPEPIREPKVLARHKALPRILTSKGDGFRILSCTNHLSQDP